jgi:glycosyltransferase involved in cell wall biosynthesis
MSAIDPIYKQVLRSGWRLLQGVIALAGSSRNADKVRVWYAGARSGSIGGPLVKVQRLQEFFPEFRVAFSHVYLLSNSPYLPGWALKWLKLRRVPIVLNQNGVFYPAWFDGDYRFKNNEMAKAWHAADYVFYQSNFCKITAEKFLGARSGPGEVLFNAVDLARFTPALKQKNSRPVFLHTGKLVQHMFYRVEALLQGFSMARSQGLDAELRIAGWIDDAVLQRSRKLSKELSIDDCVSFIGPYDQKSAPEIYRSADVYVSLTFNDACPSAVIEALACGLPVLHSQSGGVPELVTGRSGVGLKVKNGYDQIALPTIEAISLGLFEILDGLPERKILARGRAEQVFDIKNWIARHEAVFGQLSKN